MAQTINPIHRLALYAALGLLVILAAFWLSSRYNPAPPRSITFSAGSAGGAYAFARAYAADLANRGSLSQCCPAQVRLKT